MTFAHRCAVLLVAGLMVSGCSAVGTPPAAPGAGIPSPGASIAAAGPDVPSPGADAGMPALIDDEWDVVIRRELAGVSCSAHMRATGDAPDAEAASEFLKSGDWSSLEVSLDDYEQQDLEHFRGQGSTDATLLLKLITDRVNQDLVDSGLFTVNVSVETETRCD